jgi:hypothetical protein
MARAPTAALLQGLISGARHNLGRGCATKMYGAFWPVYRQQGGGAGSAPTTGLAVFGLDSMAGAGSAPATGVDEAQNRSHASVLAFLFCQ